MAAGFFYTVLRIRIFVVLDFGFLGETVSMLNFSSYKFSWVYRRIPAFFTSLIMPRCGKGNASARDRQGPWQGPLPHSSPVLHAFARWQLRRATSIVCGSLYDAQRVPRNFIPRKNSYPNGIQPVWITTVFLRPLNGKTALIQSK